MPITSFTNVTLGNLTDISANMTTPVDFFVNVNNIVYNGVFFFIMLWVAWIILFMVAQLVKDQPLNNAMLSGMSISLLAFLMRALSLVDDHQMWAFVILTVTLGTIAWATKD